LNEARLKISTVPKSEKVLVFESTDHPVVRSYENLLSVNGYVDYEVMYYSIHTDLQTQLFEDAEKYVILDANFPVFPFSAQDMRQS
jgi:hypothetical protein